MNQTREASKNSFGVVFQRWIYKNFSLLQLSGWLILFVLWWLVTNFGIINNHVMPTPQKTWSALVDMKQNDDLWNNIWFSVRINVIGYLKCILAALVIGFAIGLSPTVRKMF